MLFQELFFKIVLLSLGAVITAASLMTMPNRIIVNNFTLPKIVQINTSTLPQVISKPLETQSNKLVQAKNTKSEVKINSNKKIQENLLATTSQIINNKNQTGQISSSTLLTPIVQTPLIPSGWPALLEVNYTWATNAVGHGSEADPPGQIINFSPQSPVWKVSWSSSTKAPIGYLYPADGAFTIKVLAGGNVIFSWSSHFDKNTGNYLEGGEKLFAQKGDQLLILASAATIWEFQVSDGYPNQ